MDDYQRVSKAIDYLASHVHQQPDLAEVAAQVHLSPAHFQRLFSRWVGVSPKRFLQVLTVEQGKRCLGNSRPLLDVSQQLGLSGSARLHDHFVQLEAASPGEYRSGGAGVTIGWARGTTPFGPALIATTPRGICKLDFLDNQQALPFALADLQKQWPHAHIEEVPTLATGLLSELFKSGTDTDRPLSLHVRGTNFQVQVWRSLLQIQPGEFSSYKGIADALGKPGAARAVGGAVGSNPVAVLIPCHRVIRQTGELGGYRWGESRKRALYSWEVARF